MLTYYFLQVSFKLSEILLVFRLARFHLVQEKRTKEISTVSVYQDNNHHLLWMYFKTSYSELISFWFFFNLNVLSTGIFYPPTLWPHITNTSAKESKRRFLETLQTASWKVIYLIVQISFILEQQRRVSTCVHSHKVGISRVLTCKVQPQAKLTSTKPETHSEEVIVCCG